jgi:hypothetical protein
MQSSDMRQRAADAGTLLGLIPQLIDRSEELKVSLEAAGKETDGLRKELAALRTELHQLRSEREEMADSLTVIMNDILRLTNEAVSKLRPGERKSAFSREVHAQAGDAPAARPAPPTVPWRRSSSE